MPITTAEEFLSVLERSNLLSPAEFAEAREIAKDYTDATHFAKALIRNQIISNWQAGHMLAGRASFLLGKYKLISLLGRGGMGSVFLAAHVVMHRKVALKFIPAKIARNPAALERFLVEARTIALLDHSNIVRAYSVDNEGERYYLVMEYVEGMDLQRAVEEYGPLDLEASADYIRQAADGLAHAHKRNMIHCDIKPSNLIVTEEGVVKILDMGLARLTHDKPATAEAGVPDNHVLGSVDYLAPEQALSTPDFNHRADIYSLGCTLYFLLTGHPPFPTGTLAQRIVKHQTLEPAEIGRERPEVPANLVAICKKMMAKNPADRYQTAAEVRDVLGAWQPEVSQPEKKPIVIKKIEPLEDLRPVSPWEQEFGEELKNLAASSGANEFVMPPGMSGKMPIVKSGSSSVKLKKILAGTRERLILTSCLVAVVVVFLISGIVLSIIYSGNSESGTGSVAQSPQTPVEPVEKPKPPSPPPEPEKTPNQAAPPPAPVPPPAQETNSATPAKTKNSRPPRGKTRKTQTPPKAVTSNTQAPPNENTTEANPSATVQPPASAAANDPLKALSSAVELPDIAKPGGIALGKVRLEAKEKLQIELIGGDRLSKTFGYALQEDPNAVGGQAWNISRIEFRGKDAPAARIKLKGTELTFDWAQIPSAQAYPLRNCGLAVSVGEASRFVQFRLPLSADPLVLDFDKGTPLVHPRVDNPPDPDKLKLIIQELKKPFPANNIKPEVAMNSTKKMVEIEFTEQKYAGFSLRVSYDTPKKTTFDIEASAYYSDENGAKTFKFSTGDSKAKKLSSDLASLTRRLKTVNNPPQKTALQQLVTNVKAEQKKLSDVIGLAKILNNQEINYQIVADYEKHSVVLVDSLLLPPEEILETAQTASPPNRTAGK
jgi:serine/threonine protein kinase